MALPSATARHSADMPNVTNLMEKGEAIFISITVFVVGFGVGPLLFAPRKSQVLLVVMVLIEYPPS
jgi:hypothetical protein